MCARMASRRRIAITASTGIARPPPSPRRRCSRREAPLSSRGASARSAWTRSRASLPAHPATMYLIHCTCTAHAHALPQPHPHLHPKPHPEPPTRTPNLQPLICIPVTSPPPVHILSHLTLTLPPPSPQVRFETTVDGLEEHVAELIARTCLSPLPPAPPPSPPSSPVTGGEQDPHLHLAHQGKADEHVKGIRPPYMAAQLATAASP